MNTIDLETIIDAYGLDKKEVAEQLFPKNKYPSLALNRVFTNETTLDITQLHLLASLIGVPTYKLLRNNTWQIKSQSKDIIELHMGGYKAVINFKENNSKVYHNDSLFHEVVLHSSSIPLSEYLKTLNSIIKNHKK